MNPRDPTTGRRRAGVLAALLLVVAGGVVTNPVGAQTPPTSPPTTSLLGGLLGKLLPTTAPPTTAPPASGGGAPPQGPPPGPPKEVVCASASAAPARRGPRTGPRSTDALLGALASRQNLGYSPEELAAGGMGQFPVGGPAHYSDDWLDPRLTPCPHLHRGTDIFAARGTPVRAPEDGSVRFSEEAVGGKAAYVSGSSGTMYYMAHLDRFATGGGGRVRRGDVVGFVGNTGNADGGPPHLHFQVHPGGGAPVNPKPILDRWLDEAVAAVPTTFPERQPEATATGTPRALIVVADLRRFDVSRLTGAADPLAAEEQEWDEAEALARALLDPLSPPSLDALVATRP